MGRNAFPNKEQLNIFRNPQYASIDVFHFYQCNAICHYSLFIYTVSQTCKELHASSSSPKI